MTASTPLASAGAEVPATVVTCSTRAASGVYDDRTGPVIAAWLAARRYAVTGPVVVPDGPAVEQALRSAVAAGARLIVTTGGTGLAPSDGTPQATLAVADLEVPGIGEAIRAAGLAKGIATAALSRGTAGVVRRQGGGAADSEAEALAGAGAGAASARQPVVRGGVGTLIVNLPGSTGGVRDGLDVLDALLPHALDQLAGGDH